MAITYGILNYITPFFRDNEEALKDYDGLLGMWHGACLGGGDGSGGTITCSHFFNNVALGLLAKNVLFDVRLINAYLTGVMPADMTIEVAVATMMRTNFGAAVAYLQWNRAYNLGTTGSAAGKIITHIEPPRQKFKLCETGYSQVQFMHAANAANFALVTSAAGYLYDERYMRSD